jgi:hypothetical protein
MLDWSMIWLTWPQAAPDGKRKETKSRNWEGAVGDSLWADRMKAMIRRWRSIEEGLLLDSRNWGERRCIPVSDLLGRWEVCTVSAFPSMIQLQGSLALMYALLWSSDLPVYKKGKRKEKRSRNHELSLKGNGGFVISFRKERTQSPST